MFIAINTGCLFIKLMLNCIVLCFKIKLNHTFTKYANLQFTTYEIRTEKVRGSEENVKFKIFDYFFDYNFFVKMLEKFKYVFDDFTGSLLWIIKQ